MKIEIETVKGFRDILPPESIKRQAVKSIIEKNFRLHGFLPVETPVIEFDELMKSELPSEEDEAVSDRFRLKDRAGRNLGLRYEFTFQLSRILLQNPTIKLPLRRYQIGEVFRDEPIGQDRFRQFTQCDADIVGDSSIESDFECLSLISDILNELNIEAEIQINNRRLLQAIIESVEIKAAKQVMRELDKLDKIGEDNVKLNLKKYADTNQILTLFKLLEKNLRFFKDNNFDGASEIMELIELCADNNVQIEFNPILVRGLGYYTGNIFEVKKEGKSTIAAGGRYDDTVGKLLGKQIPSVGISFGLDRIASLTTIEANKRPIVIISINQDKAARKLTKKLRNEEIPAITFIGKTGKGLEYADSLESPYVVFIGQEEVKNKKIKARNMKSGEEKELTEQQLIKEING